MKYFIGIDISKDTFNYCVINCQDVTLEASQLSMNQEGFDKLQEILYKHLDSAVAMESTGSYHINLLSFILSFKQEVFLINPLLIKRFTQTMTLRKTKTDKADAKVIAQFARQNCESLSYYHLTESCDISALARTREDLSKQIAKAKTQLKQQVNRTFPEFLNEFNIFTDTALEVLAQFPTTQMIKNTDQQGIADIILSVGGRRSTMTAERLKNLADLSIGRNSAQLEKLVRHHVKMLQFLMEQLDQLTLDFIDAANQVSEEEMQIISSIKGISEITASHFLAEIHSIDRFESRGSLIAFAGTDPAVNESGTSLHRRGKISKKGSSSLRRCVYLMATGVMRSNEYFRSYYLKKRQQGMQHRKAMIALCNKLLRVLFALLKKREKFIMPVHNL